jgi:hypothetical protein
MISQQQEQFLDVLEQSLGIVSVALQKTGNSQEDYAEWTKNIFFNQRLKKIDEVCADYVENQLLRQIKEGNTQAITFYLKTKGKSRGYN